MLQFFMFLYLFVVLAMVGVILLQKSEGGGLVSSNTGSLLTSRGTKNLLTRITAILAACFLGLCILLAVLTRMESDRHSKILDVPTQKKEAPAETPANLASKTEAAPAAPAENPTPAAEAAAPVAK